MLRLTELAQDDRGVALKVEGRIAAEWSTFLEAQCRERLASGSRLRLEMSGVSYVDRSGVAALRRLRATPVELLECPPVILELLEEEAL